MVAATREVEGTLPFELLGFDTDNGSEFLNWPKDGRKPWSIFDFVDWCADHDVPGAELASYFFPPDVNEAWLLELKRHCYLRGVQIAGTAVGNNFALPKGDKLNEEIAYTKMDRPFRHHGRTAHPRVCRPAA